LSKSVRTLGYPGSEGLLLQMQRSIPWRGVHGKGLQSAGAMVLRKSMEQVSLHLLHQRPSRMPSSLRSLSQEIRIWTFQVI